MATTGLLYRIIVNRILTNYKWIALGLLMLAGVIDSYGGFHSNVPNTEKIFITAECLVMIFTYTSISGFAAVYTEYIMKKTVKDAGMKVNSEDGHLPMYNKQTPGKTNGAVWAFMLILEVMIYGSFSILVNLSKVDRKLPYSTSTVVLLIEFTKIKRYDFFGPLSIIVSGTLFWAVADVNPYQLVFSAAMYLSQFMNKKIRIPRLSIQTCASYSIPAVLYMLNNNLGLHMQTQMDPTTYQVLSNLKIATTAFLYRIIIKRILTSYQWIALGLLMFAGVCDSYGSFHSNVPNTEKIFITAEGLVMIFTSTSISGLAAVYTEYIMKKQLKVSIHIQNMLLYTYGVALNLFSSWWNSNISHDHSHDFFQGFSSYTWLIVFTQALNGLIMSVVIKHGSNVTRLFIISGAMLTSTLLSVLILGTMINFSFIVAAALVILAIYLYHK